MTVSEFKHHSSSLQRSTRHVLKTHLRIVNRGKSWRCAPLQTCGFLSIDLACCRLGLG